MENTTEPQFQNLNTNTVNKSVLIIGGGGYIGSHIAKHLQRNGYTPVIVDRNINTIIALAFNDCYEMDLPREVHLLDDLVKRYNIDSCIHTAAYTSVGESMLEPDKYYQNNVVMTLQVLNKLKQLDVKKFIFSSNRWSFGQCPEVFSSLDCFKKIDFEFPIPNIYCKYYWLLIYWHTCWLSSKKQ